MNPVRSTVLGSNNVSMSGGQLPRLCLARALYRKPYVVLLDAATSALEIVSESAIFQTSVNLRDTTGLTMVSVSHHPSTALEADEIVVLDQGRIAEREVHSRSLNLSRMAFSEDFSMAKKQKVIF